MPCLMERWLICLWLVGVARARVGVWSRLAPRVRGGVALRSPRARLSAKTHARGDAIACKFKVLRAGSKSEDS